MHLSQGSQAYARALAKAGVLTEDEAATIVSGLDTVAGEWETGVFKVRPSPFTLRACNPQRRTPSSSFLEIHALPVNVRVHGQGADAATCPPSGNPVHPNWSVRMHMSQGSALD